MKRVLFICALVAIAVGATTLVTAKPKPSNGGFEQGFNGWERVKSNNYGKWRIYRKGDAPEDGGGLPPRGIQELKPYYDPPQGKKAAVTQQTAEGTRLLLRRLKLKADSKITLSLYAFYQNYNSRFHTPNTLELDEGEPMPRRGSQSNQQFRIDIIKASANPYSLESGDVLKTVFRTKVGDKNRRPPFKLKANLSSLAGQTVKLRMAEVDNRGYFAAGVDAIRLRTKPAG